MPSFKPKERSEDDQNIWNVTLPLDVYWGIYARQSTQGQVLNHTQSTEMQTEDLIQWLVVKGVQDGRVFLFDADLGVSGTLRIDQRTGLQELVVMIKQGKIKAVLVYQISRLFRDETGVQYNVFADICKQHNCLLVTADGMIFNFRNPMHLKMFRFLAEMAAEYIPQQIGLLHQARLRKARKGFYAGMGSVPRGYIVDYNEKSTSFRKLTPYRPHADIVFSLFQRFFELDGDFARLCRELQELFVIFPPFEETVDPRNTRNNHFKKVLDGYYLTRGGLVCILTNPVYIGWCIVKGDVISRNNHERIIDEEHEYLFWYAFDRLSEYTVDGKMNENRSWKKRPYYQRSTVNPDGLLKNRIRGVTDGIYTHIHAKTSVYCTKDKKKQFVYQIGDMVNVALIDTEFLKRFFAHLR